MFGKKKVYYAEDTTGWVQGRKILAESHILIAGSTGCGKSTLIHDLMWTALASVPTYTQFILIDMKAGMELGRYATLPHTLAFARSAEEAISALDYAQQIMIDRCNQMFSSGQTMWQGSDIYVVIDELGFLLQSCGSEALKRLVLISQQGRAAKVHLLLATQNPSKQGIPAAIQQNMTCLIGMKCRDAIQSRQIIGQAGCESLPSHGLAYIILGTDLYQLPITPESDETYRKRIAYWSDPKNYIRKVRPGKPPHRGADGPG